jgi:hypothetical protein
MSKSSFQTFSQITTEEAPSGSAIPKYELLPVGFVVAWILLLIVYSLHVANAITF